MAKFSSKMLLKVCVMTAEVLTLLSILCTVAVSYWQDIVRVKLDQTVTVPVDQALPYREGWFYRCTAESKKNEDLSGFDLPCQEREYSTNGAEWDDAMGLILEFRRISVASFFLASLVALFGFIVLLPFMWFWFTANYLSGNLGYQYVFVGSVLFLSGLLYEVTLFFTHFAYLEEKSLRTNGLRHIFSGWTRELRTGVTVEYSSSYVLLFIATLLIYFAGILIFVSGYFATEVTNKERSDRNLLRAAFMGEVELPRYRAEEWTFDNDVRVKSPEPTPHTVRKIPP